MISPALIIGTTFELKDHRAKPIIEKHKDLNIFKNIHGVITGSWLVDRTNTVSMPLRSTSLEKYNIPNFDNIQLMELVDCCVFRAKELAASNKSIFFTVS
jgi:hypothetical protein